MKKQTNTIDISAGPGRIWETLWTDKTYREWTSVFCDGSHAVSDWNEGSRVHFLSGDGRGMYSEIEKLVENELMSFSHIGELLDGKEQPLTEETQTWSGAREIYTLTPNQSVTTLTLEMDILETHAEYFEETIPKALEKLKHIAEERTPITIETIVNATLADAWTTWTDPEQITKWNFASDEWCCPRAENDLRAGGRFSSRMEAKDGSFGFDFEGEYTAVEPLRSIAYKLGDGRKVAILFTETDGGTKVVETFEAETDNPNSLQQAGWQAILENFKKQAESKNGD
jgi:uncharacterized protein YndB with AHSA1/START domain